MLAALDLCSYSWKYSLKDGITHPQIVGQIASSLNTPHVPTRKTILDVLVFLLYWQEGRAQQLVVDALQELSTANHEEPTCYAYWFKSLETALAGRGRMGTLVGASDEVKRHGGIDSSLNDYTVSQTAYYFYASRANFRCS